MMAPPIILICIQLNLTYVNATPIIIARAYYMVMIAANFYFSCTACIWSGALMYTGPAVSETTRFRAHSCHMCQWTFYKLNRCPPPQINLSTLYQSIVFVYLNDCITPIHCKHLQSISNFSNNITKKFWPLPAFDWASFYWHCNPPLQMYRQMFSDSDKSNTPDIQK